MFGASKLKGLGLWVVFRVGWVWIQGVEQSQGAGASLTFLRVTSVKIKRAERI